AILESEGRAQAVAVVYNAIKQADPDQTMVAILQLETLAKFAESDNAKIVVPYESAGLMGAAEALRSALGGASTVSSGSSSGARVRRTNWGRACPLVRIRVRWFEPEAASGSMVAVPSGEAMDIDVLEAIEMGDSTQWIRIRGADRSNPVLLLIQQGPGLP